VRNQPEQRMVYNKGKLLMIDWVGEPGTSSFGSVNLSAGATQWLRRR